MIEVPPQNRLLPHCQKLGTYFELCCRLVLQMVRVNQFHYMENRSNPDVPCLDLIICCTVAREELFVEPTLHQSYSSPQRGRPSRQSPAHAKPMKIAYPQGKTWLLGVAGMSREALDVNTTMGFAVFRVLSRK
jgi:hypothetical protein